MPDAQTVLDLWDRAEREHPIDRDVSVLEAFTAESRNSLSELPLHRRDALLIQSRIAAFGATLNGVASCPGCSCRIDVLLRLPDGSAAPAEDGGFVEVEGSRARFRVPNSRDLAEAARADNAEVAAKTLLARCQLSGPHNESVARAIDEGIARFCEASTIEVRMTCPECHHEFVLPVDIGQFLWQEIVSYARGALTEVDALALRYGWSEAEVLALSERRRKRYLEYCT
jgi:hypothetical protein